tara:strand:+ start:32 stop:166 length:135 start_codon:yes stop_codon:yes gene_type:complete
MKIILFCVIAVLLWNNDQARQYTSDQLKKAADIIKPDTTINIKL